jgi:hypothetical protein
MQPILIRFATAVTQATAIMNAFKTDEQRKAYWASRGGGGHGGGTAHGASAAKAHEAGFEDKMAKAFEMGLGLGKDMLGGLGVAGEAATLGKSADRINKLRDFFRKVAADAPEVSHAQPIGVKARPGAIAEVNALNDTFREAMSRASKATPEEAAGILKKTRERIEEAALAKHGTVDTHSNMLMRQLREQEFNLTGAKYPLPAWSTPAPAKPFVSESQRAIGNSHHPLRRFFMLNRRPLTQEQKVAIILKGKGRGAGGGKAKDYGYTDHGWSGASTGADTAPAEIPFNDGSKSEPAPSADAGREWRGYDKAPAPGNDQDKKDRQEMEIQAARLRAGQGALNQQSKDRAKRAWAEYERQVNAGEAGKPNPKADRAYNAAKALEGSMNAQSSYQQRYNEVRQMADAIHANNYRSPDGTKYRVTPIQNRRPMTDAQRRGMFASRARGGNNIAPQGGTAPVSLRRDGNNIAPPPGAPTTVTSTVTGPNSTVHRTTQTGFPRPAPQAGAVGGAPGDQLRKPRPTDQINPGSGRPGPEAPPPPVQGPQETSRSYYQRMAEWEKKYSPDHALRPLGGGGVPGSPGTRDADATRKMADQIKKKAAQKKKTAASQVQNPYAGAPMDGAPTNSGSLVRKDPPLSMDPGAVAARARFAGLPIAYGR